MTISQSAQQEYYKLFIDESGTANPKDLSSDIYILSGCSINKSECQKIKVFADQIKFKYWGKTDVVFHSNEIGRQEGDFSILKDEKIYKNFLEDLSNFLSYSNFKMFFIIVDKKKAREAGWDDKKVYKDTTLFLVRNFLLILLTSDSKGEIIIESASAEKDIFLLQALGYFWGAGIEALNIKHETVKNTVSSVSFVTKQNNDIEEQIADLFGYAAKLKYFQKQKIKFKSDPYEEIVLKAINKKIFKIPRQAGQGKLRLFSEVEPFLILL